MSRRDPLDAVMSGESEPFVADGGAAEFTSQGPGRRVPQVTWTSSWAELVDEECAGGGYEAPHHWEAKGHSVDESFDIREVDQVGKFLAWSGDRVFFSAEDENGWVTVQSVPRQPEGHARGDCVR